jgi:hypothetical protein
VMILKVAIAISPRSISRARRSADGEPPALRVTQCRLTPADRVPAISAER